MSATDMNHPYQILEIRTTASEQQIIARNRELTREVLDKKRKALLRKAMEDLTGTRLGRAVAQFFEPPESAYSSAPTDALLAEPAAAPDADEQFLKGRAERFAHQDCDPSRLAGIAAPPADEASARTRLDCMGIALLDQ